MNPSETAAGLEHTECWKGKSCPGSFSTYSTRKNFGLQKKKHALRSGSNVCRISAPRTAADSARVRSETKLHLESICSLNFNSTKPRSSAPHTDSIFPWHARRLCSWPPPANLPLRWHQAPDHVGAFTNREKKNTCSFRFFQRPDLKPNCFSLH